MTDLLLGENVEKRRTHIGCAAFLQFLRSKKSLVTYESFHVTTFVIGSVSGDGKPEVAATIDHDAVTSRNVQTRERGTVGIMAGGIDGITRAIDLSREGHVAQIVAADGYAGDRSRGSDAAA